MTEVVRGSHTADKVLGSNYGMLFNLRRIITKGGECEIVSQ